MKEINRCSFCGSTDRVCHFHGGELLCMKHYLQMRNYGQLFSEDKSKCTNKIQYNNTACQIITAKGETILVDKDMLPRLANHSWCVSKTGYAVANINKTLVRMHRLITDCPSGKVVDHINGN